MDPSRHSRRGRRLVLVARGPPRADGRHGADRPPVPVDGVLRADQRKQDYSAHELHGAFAFSSSRRFSFTSFSIYKVGFPHETLFINHGLFLLRPSGALAMSERTKMAHRAKSVAIPMTEWSAVLAEGVAMMIYHFLAASVVVVTATLSPQLTAMRLVLIALGGTWQLGQRGGE